MKERYEMIHAIVADLKDFQKRDEFGFWEHMEELETSFLVKLDDAALEALYNDTVDREDTEEKVLIDPNVKYPQIQVTLIGEDGNAFAILGRVQNAMRNAGVSKAEIDSFMKEAMSGDYDHLLQTCMAWVDVR